MKHGENNSTIFQRIPSLHEILQVTARMENRMRLFFLKQKINLKILVEESVTRVVVNLLFH